MNVSAETHFAKPQKRSFRMPEPVVNPVLTELRDRIRRMEGAGRRTNGVLPFGVQEIDRRLPGEGWRWVSCMRSTQLDTSIHVENGACDIVVLD